MDTLHLKNRNQLKLYLRNTTNESEYPRYEQHHPTSPDGEIKWFQNSKVSEGFEIVIQF